jgi:2-haloacid dehalogenase
MKYELVILDIDDTLFDYNQTEQYALKMACRMSGIHMPFASVYKEYKLANVMAKSRIDILVPENLTHFRHVRASIFLAFIGRGDIEAESFIAQYLKYSTTGILIDGVYETLARLSDVTKVAATNGSDFPRKDKLMKSSIACFFDGYYSSEMLGISKPNPQFFLSILEAKGFVKEHVLIVGDDFKTDIQGALNANIDSCLFSYRNAVSQLELPPRVFEISRFTELYEIVKGEKA